MLTGTNLVTTNYIGGQWKRPGSSEEIDLISPVNGEQVGKVRLSNEEDVDQAAHAAKRAWPGWKTMPGPERGALLQKTADLLSGQEGRDIAEITAKEMGKRYSDAYGEVVRGAEILHYFAQDAWRSVGEVLPSITSGKLFYSKRFPVGIIGVISPWNFPISIPIWKMAPALAYGNTIVFKPATITSFTGMKLVEIFEKAGFPKGVINFVTGSGSITGRAIAKHPAIQAITFTGSTSVGQQLAKLAVEHRKKFQLELGGKNPTIVLDDANVSKATNLIVASAMKQTGQRCTATSRVYVQSGIYDEFKKHVLNNVKAIKVGNNFDENVDMSSLSSENALKSVLGYIKKGIEEGATLLYGGHQLTHGNFAKGCFVQPTVFEHVTQQMTIAREEIFGPVLAMIKIKSYEEGLALANDTEYGLSASIFTNDIAKALDFIENSEAGLVQVNSETGGTELQAPFGGVKASGYGAKEQGQAAKEFFTTLKTSSMISL